MSLEAQPLGFSGMGVSWCTILVEVPTAHCSGTNMAIKSVVRSNGFESGRAGEPPFMMLPPMTPHRPVAFLCDVVILVQGFVIAGIGRIVVI